VREGIIKVRGGMVSSNSNSVNFSTGYSDSDSYGVYNNSQKGTIEVSGGVISSTSTSTSSKEYSTSYGIYGNGIMEVRRRKN